jgi:TPR repeat protein
MARQKTAIGLVAIALFAGASTAHGPVLSDRVNTDRRVDYTTALRILRELDAQGHAVTQYNLGVLYRNGLGVPQDYTEALKWFRKAADQGDASAQTYIGIMYHKGEGVTQDSSAAVKWFRKAAEQGQAIAQTRLGIMYRNGRGVTQDYVQAHMWYNLSAVKGSKIARKSRDKLATQMTPAQIAEAQRLAREWKPN